MTEFNAPTREFYEQNERATILRNLSLSALDVAHDVLVSDGDDEDALATLLDINTQLADMGITPSMHVMRPGEPDPEAYRQRMAYDPVMASEWIAGQVRKSLIDNNGFTDSGSPKTLVEHDELLGEGGDTSLIEFRHASPQAQKFIVSLGVIGALQGLLDYDAGPSELH